MAETSMSFWNIIHLAPDDFEAFEIHDLHFLFVNHSSWKVGSVYFYSCLTTNLKNKISHIVLIVTKVGKNRIEPFAPNWCTIKEKKKNLFTSFNKSYNTHEKLNVWPN